MGNPRPQLTSPSSPSSSPSPVMPAAIKVGPLTFRVEKSADRISETAFDVGSDLYGFTDHTATDVVLAETMSEQMDRMVLVHELLHCLLRPIIHGLTPEEEEAVVSQLAYGLLALLRDNPDLLHYLCHQ